MDSFRLSEGMRLGVATSATQIEGGDTNNSWYDWYKAGHIKDGSSPERADGHYTRLREDTRLMAEMGIQVYRFGVEWSRIEPQEGVFDEDALYHYREELLLLREQGIEPLLTLHHFTNPRWFEDKGAFECDSCVDLFLRFVEKTVAVLGDLVDEYVTINEPNVYVTNGYFFGSWPPGKKSFAAVRKVYVNMARCHIGAYNLIHQMRRKRGFTDTKVGFAMHMRVFEPKDARNLYHRKCAQLSELFFQTAISRAMALGDCVFPIPKASGIHPGSYADFLGVNYYSRSTVSGLADGVRAGCPVNDLGWEIYPYGIVRCCKALYDMLPVPLYITENGTCDNNDAFRSRYIYEHLKALCESGLPVERYYHWCFIDNWEWLEGESARFGLVHIDYASQTREIKESGRFYSAVIREGGVTQELYDSYCRQEYHTNR